MILRGCMQLFVPSTDRVATILAFIVMGLMAAEARDFKATDTQPKDHPTVQAIVHMDRLVRDRTQDRHRINVYPGGMLGEQRATFEQTRLGAIDINRTNMAPLSSFVGEVNVLGLPFLFRSADHLHKVLDGPIGDAILQSLEPHGLVPARNRASVSGLNPTLTATTPNRGPWLYLGARLNHFDKKLTLGSLP